MILLQLTNNDVAPWHLCSNGNMLEWFVYVTVNVAIVRFMEWVKWNELQDWNTITTLGEIMFKILALLSSFLLFHSNWTMNLLQASVTLHHKVPMLAVVPLCTYICFHSMIVLCATLVFFFILWLAGSVHGQDDIFLRQDFLFNGVGSLGFLNELQGTI